MRDILDITWKRMPACSCHRVPGKTAFWPSKKSIIGPFKGPFRKYSKQYQLVVIFDPSSTLDFFLSGEMIVVDDGSSEVEHMIAHQSSRSRPPIHYMGCVATIILDWVWFLAELLQSFSVAQWPRIVGIIAGVFITCFIAVAVVQRFTAHDSWGSSLLKGSIMGAAAGIPYPVVGTFVGVVLLATARIYWRTPTEEEQS
jgi:hypothetical protein